MRISGKNAYVDGVSCTQSWSVNAESSVNRYAASCAPDGTVTTEGNEDWTGQMTGFGYLPPFPLVDDFDFVGVANAKLGQLVNYEGSILVQETTINIPIAEGLPINWTSSFGVQGDLSKTTAVQYVDATRVPGPSAKNAKISIEGMPDSNTFTDLADVQAATLVFRRPPVTSVSAGLTYREAGNLEVDLNFQVHNDDLEIAAYALNAIKRVRVYVTDALFFLFDAIQWQAKTNFQVVRGPQPQMVGYQVNGLWTALRTQTPAALGEILLPGGATLYPTGDS